MITIFFETGQIFEFFPPIVMFGRKVLVYKADSENVYFVDSHFHMYKTSINRFSWWVNEGLAKQIL